MQKNIFYKTQIDGFSEVAETARVIEKSAASRIHFLKKKTAALSEYKRQIQTEFRRLSRFYWDDDHPLLQERINGERALLVITGEKGIVGGLYHELINEAIARRKDYEQIWVVGSKGEEYLGEEGVQAERAFALLNFGDLLYNEEMRPVRDSESSPHTGPLQNRQSAPLKTGSLTGREISNGVHKITERLFERFQEANLKNIDVLYARFVSLAEQIPAVAKFLPFSFVENRPFDFAPAAVKAKTSARDESADGFPIFEPSKKLIFDELLKKYIDVSFTEIILEAKLSEFSARTVTAESAVKETERLIKTFNRKFLKVKHLTITQKQVESFRVHRVRSLGQKNF